MHKVYIRGHGLAFESQHLAEIHSFAHAAMTTLADQLGHWMAWQSVWVQVAK